MIEQIEEQLQSSLTNDLMISIGGITLFVVMAGFITTTQAGFNSILSAILIVPAYLCGEGFYALALRRWPNLSAENSGFSLLRIAKGALAGTALLFAAIALFFALLP